MSFDISLDMMADKGIAKITLSGELDASVAPQFRDKIEEAAGQNPKRLVLIVGGLSYIASAGLRMLIFAKQKMTGDSDIYVIGAQQQVVETLQMTGFHHSVTMLDSYDAEQIENV
jgi:anti-sigma B factor antagonist